MKGFSVKLKRQPFAYHIIWLIGALWYVSRGILFTDFFTSGGKTEISVIIVYGRHSHLSDLKVALVAARVERRGLE